MSTLEQDLATLNFDYLMLARECARANPLEAVWRFGVDRQQIDDIAGFSLEKIRALSIVGRSVFTVLPSNTPAHVPIATHAALLVPVQPQPEVEE